MNYRPGGNYGWYLAEGHSSLPNIMNPIYTYSHGPVTSETLRKKGMKPTFEASKHDIPGLTAAIVKYFKAKH
jgi:uroporphyrinogen III methyltransferase/synthase